MSLLKFPSGFLWGAATSSYQVEGAHDEDGRSPSIWDTFSRQPGRVREAHNGDVACDSYHRIDEDVALLKALGAKTYRFSVAWPRVVPTGRGAVNEKGLDYYRRLVDALIAADIEPMLTLYHWDLPQCLQDQGGWQVRQTAHDFVAYAEAVFKALAGRVRLWITMNEPWCIANLSHQMGEHAPGLRDHQAAVSAAHHVLLAHGLAVRKFRELGLPGEIGMAPNVDWREPYSQRQEDLDACRRGLEWFNNWYLDPIYRGHYPEEMLQRYAALGVEPPVESGDMEIISSKTDFLGINYYTGSYTRAHDTPTPLQRTGDVTQELAALLNVGSVDVTGFKHTDIGWAHFPEGFYRVLLWLRDRYGNPPVYITENGACYNDEPDADGRVRDGRRIAYYEHHLIALHRAIRSGCNLKGYTAWSLLDNFEWAWGYTMRFGLVHVDFKTLKRTPKDSFHWLKQVYEANALRPGEAGRLAH
ncbi:GH1 family beta-glucosidase [Caldimonas brevitalea]|uniref:Beta-glucosidase n=1 Tax=Caldimonas brevitalea TaxID=413882 RepID=A0A0G3BK76_9BURK|nr:GH1 family beta-glucosidase [Caldimonas brevitalea]AKJ27761.1 beta-glucosidase [Caldimonas brevitalea]